MLKLNNLAQLLTLQIDLPQLVLLQLDLLTPHCLLYFPHLLATSAGLLLGVARDIDLVLLMVNFATQRVFSKWRMAYLDSRASIYLERRWLHLALVERAMH